MRVWHAARADMMGLGKEMKVSKRDWLLSCVGELQNEKPVVI